MKDIHITFKKNGYIVDYSGFLRDNGEVVYKFTEELKLVEELGKMLLDKRIEVKER